MLVYLFFKIDAVICTLITRNIATVGFPATPLMESRIRFCLSTAHTKEHLDYVLSHIEQQTCVRIKLLKETSQSRSAIIAISRRTKSFYIFYMRILCVYLIVIFFILFLCLAISQERSILLLNESLNRGGITPGRNLYSLLALLYMLSKCF